MKDMRDKLEKLGCLIDELENISQAITIPMRPEIHVDGLKILLPKLVDDFKSLFVQISGENPVQDLENEIKALKEQLEVKKVCSDCAFYNNKYCYSLCIKIMENFGCIKFRVKEKLGLSENKK